ncbi:MAG TPA: glycoside hydrolase family 13 protein [Oscillatoriaceae cyanobacterium]
MAGIVENLFRKFDRSVATTAAAKAETGLEVAAKSATLGSDALKLSPQVRSLAEAKAKGTTAIAGSRTKLAQRANVAAAAPTSPPPDWVKDTVWYQVFPERFANGNPANDPIGVVKDWDHGTPTFDNYFGGDLKGLTDNIPKLKDLGVNGLYINPLFKSDSNHKYFATDYMQIDPEFGTLADFDKMVQTAHDNGMKVILDGVFNHTSDQNPMFQDAIAKGKGSSYFDWYRIHGDKVTTNPINYDTYYGFGFMPELNVAGNPDVQNYLCSVADFWTRRGIDGWRLDVPLMIQSPEFWQKFRQTVKTANPDAYIVGEAWQNHGDNPLPWVQGDQFDAVMNYQYYENMKDFFAHDSMSVDQFDLAQMGLRNQWPKGVMDAEFNLIDSHDTPRFLSEAGGDTNRLKMAATYQMTHPGAPVVYYGDEIGMNGGADPMNRQPYAWNNQNTDVRNFYKKLIGLRNQYPALRSGGSYDTLMRHNDYQQMVVYRSDGKDTFLVALNKGTNPTVTLDTTNGNLAHIAIPDGSQFTDVLGNAGSVTSAGGKLVMNVPPGGEAIFKLSNNAK